MISSLLSHQLIALKEIYNTYIEEKVKQSKNNWKEESR